MLQMILLSLSTIHLSMSYLGIFWLFLEIFPFFTSIIYFLDLSMDSNTLFGFGSLCSKLSYSLCSFLAGWFGPSCCIGTAWRPHALVEGDAKMKSPPDWWALVSCLVGMSITIYQPLLPHGLGLQVGTKSSIVRWTPMLAYKSYKDNLAMFLFQDQNHISHAP